MCFGAACLTSLFLLWVGIFKPKFFWRSSQVMNVRRRLGDQQAQMLYAGIGLLLLVVLLSIYGLAFLLAQLLYVAIFGAIVFAGVQVYFWFRTPKQSRKAAKLERQRQQLKKLIRL